MNIYWGLLITAYFLLAQPACRSVHCNSQLIIILIYLHGRKIDAQLTWYSPLPRCFRLKFLINIFFHWHTKSALRWTRFFLFLFLIFVILISLTIFTVLNYECRSKIILAIIKSFYTSLKLIKFSNFAVFVWYTGLAQFSLIIKRCKNSHSSIKYLLLR